ncbi:hypothetical protein [Mitsuaria sp. GD03876]|uniref:hypothetical protein n=1 Tax=Mitsuaria sp. GD03876 TaxID=2975399 RepID=UPI002449AFC5|nr:hypothetical protein [Mitsuaria sp. GD03876]MDH0867077.1 hypothetical protein [Mitsuaria sp. GD03876]
MTPIGRRFVVAAWIAASAGCATTFSIEPQLNAMIGVYVGESRLALNASSRKLVSDDGHRRVMIYSHFNKCQYILEMDSQTFVVLSWTYVSHEAMLSCRRQPAPVYV